MNSLLVNEKECRKFLEEMLPPLLSDVEVYLLFLFARKKYNPLVKDEYNLSREMIGEKDVDEFIRKIKRMSLIDNDYIDYTTKTLIPIDSMVFYIDLSPKSLLKAWNLLSKEMNDLLYQSIIDPNNLIRLKKIKTKLMSAIHKSNARKPYMLLDIDVIDEEILEKCLEAIHHEYKWITATRGGYHVIVEKTKEHGKWIYENIIKQFSEDITTFANNIEIKNDIMTPIVGTLQGGKEVKKWG